MALQTPVLLETAVLDHTVLTAASVHIIGTVPENCVVIASGSECVSAATVGGANAVSLGVTGGDVDSVGTVDINGGKTAAAILTTVNGVSKFTNAATVISAVTAGANAPTAGSYKFFVAYVPMGATLPAAVADRDLLD
tara:strand:+ start:1209 stop:1622 length:414 start_codon:yes stop_codon:yes gene_type:complete